MSTWLCYHVLIYSLYSVDSCSVHATVIHFQVTSSFVYGWSLSKKQLHAVDVALKHTATFLGVWVVLW